MLSMGFRADKHFATLALMDETSDGAVSTWCWSAWSGRERLGSGISNSRDGAKAAALQRSFGVTKGKLNGRR